MTPLRILIADDNAIVRSLIRKFLEFESGWTVCGEAENGEDAVDKTIELKPDVLLLDMSMPKLDGWRACQLLRAQVPETKILLVTENDPGVMEAVVTMTGAHGFVAKSDVIFRLKDAVVAAMKKTY